MRLRGATASAAGLVLALVASGPATATGQAAEAPDPLDITPYQSVVPFNGWYELTITDGAVYFTTLNEGPPDWTGRSEVWRRTIYRTPDGVVLGNAQLIGHSLNDIHRQSIGASDDGILWTDVYTRRLMRHDDDGTTTVVSGPGMPDVDSYSGEWFTADGVLWPVPADRPGAQPATLLGRSGVGWPWNPAETEVHLELVAHTDSLVVWAEVGAQFDPEWVQSGYRIYANTVDANGLVGEPVLLDEGYGPEITGLPSAIDVSGEYVAWVTGYGGPMTLSWVAVPDLGAPPERLAFDGRGPHIGLDGTRLAYTTWDPATLDQEIVVRDLAAGTVVATLPYHVDRVGLEGDLVVWEGWSLPGGHLRLASVTGATRVSLAPQFTDVALSPFLPHIDRLAMDGVTTGHPDGTYRPMASVTREAMAAFLYRQAGEPAFTSPTTSPFTDVSTGHPFYAEICWLAAEGISTGWAEDDGTTTFRPGEPVSREAMAAFLHRYAGPSFTPPPTSPFTDVTDGHPFYEAITWLADAGISTGWATSDGAEFRPGANIERQAMAAFLVRLADLF